MPRFGTPLLWTLVALYALVAPPNGVCVRAEWVRKAWERYSMEEKETYLGAVAAAMDSGLHYRFAEVHSSSPTYDHAHGNCGFLLWHRRFLLAYERMLRSQDPEYADVTVPYWNYFRDHDKQLAARVPCDSWASCSRFLTDMGGSDLDARVRTTAVAQARERGLCVNSGVAGHGCALADGEDDATGECEHCIVRGDWDDPWSFLPITKAELLATIRDSVAASGSENVSSSVPKATSPHDRLRQQLEYGFHAQVHNDLGGIMRTSASPHDPVFYGHHALLDLVQFVHNRCHFGHADMDSDEAEKQQRKYDVFQQCIVHMRDSSSAHITAMSHVLMYYKGEPVEEDEELGVFFLDDGDATYKDFANSEALAQSGNEYRYELDAFFVELLEDEGVRCPADMYPSSTRTSTSKRAKAAYGPEPEYEDEDDDEDQDQDPPEVREIIVALAQCGHELHEAQPELSREQVSLQQSALECEATRQRGGGGQLQDFSPDFREAFRIPADNEPFCLELLRRVATGDMPLVLSDDCREHYGELTDTDLGPDGFGRDFSVAGGATEAPEATGEHHRNHLSIRIRSH